MKYSKIKNIILAIIPVILFYLYQNIQITMQLNVNATFDRLPLTLFKMIAPCIIGIYVFFVIAYTHSNRNSLVFVSLFCGAFLVSILYIGFTLGWLGLRRNSIDMSAASQIAYVLVGAYGTGFWVSLISYIRGKRKKG